MTALTEAKRILAHPETHLSGPEWIALVERLVAEITAQDSLPPAPPFHRMNQDCAFDRTASHSAGHYVCACGWTEHADQT